MICCTDCTCRAWVLSCGLGCVAAGQLLKQKPEEEEGLVSGQLGSIGVVRCAVECPVDSVQCSAVQCSAVQCSAVQCSVAGPNCWLV